jgi:hypothetical protein
LVPIDAFRTPYGGDLADLVAASGGILGGVTRATSGVHGGLLDDIDQLLDTILRLASERALDVDLQVDESGDPAATALAHVAAAVLRNRFKGRLVCGHCGPGAVGARPRGPRRSRKTACDGSRPAVCASCRRSRTQASGLRGS